MTSSASSSDPSSSSPSPSQDVTQALARAQPPATPLHLESTDILESLVSPIAVSPRSRRSTITNWGGSFTSRPTRVFQPTTVEQCCAILELARRQGQRVRAVGKAHSPSDLMMSDQWSIRMEGLGGTLDIDAAVGEKDGAATVKAITSPSSSSSSSSSMPSATFLGGTLISDMNDILASTTPPLAMTSLGSISEQTIGGLVSTATHGSGYHFPAVSALVQHLDMAVVLPPEQGGVQVVRCSREENADLFNATLCGLGATGLIVAVKIQVEPAFRLSHLVEETDFDFMFGAATGYPSIERADYDDELRPSQSPRRRRVPLGHLVAAGEPLPPPQERYLPQARQSSPSTIFPVESTDDSRLIRSNPEDVEDDSVTRDAQRRLDSFVRSSQHARIWYFPHVGMCTLSRADRTLQPAVGPTWGQRLYHSLVGYHLGQALLFAARYHRGLPEPFAKLMHRLTHPTYPLELRRGASGAGAEQGEAAAADSSTSAAISATTESAMADLGSEYGRFQSSPGLDPLSNPSNASSPSSSSSNLLQPLRPTHPHSRSVDDSWKVFNMDCLYPQYTTEWAVPYHHTAAVLRTLRDWLAAEQASHQGLRFHFPIEVRFSAADGIWLSPASGRRTTYIGLVQYRPYDQPVPYRLLFSRFETVMRHFAGRPHWAKAHSCGAKELEVLYPHLGEWRTARRKWDPLGVMSGGAYVRRHLDAEIGEGVGVRRFKRREQGKL